MLMRASPLPGPSSPTPPAFRQVRSSACSSTTSTRPTSSSASRRHLLHGHQVPACPIAPPGPHVDLVCGVGVTVCCLISLSVGLYCTPCCLGSPKVAGLGPSWATAPGEPSAACILSVGSAASRLGACMCRGSEPASLPALDSTSPTVCWSRHDRNLQGTQARRLHL